jgi:hypothetical protein
VQNYLQRGTVERSSGQETSTQSVVLS